MATEWVVQAASTAAWSAQSGSAVSWTPQGGPTTSWAIVIPEIAETVGGRLLLEGGGFLLLEGGGFLLLESDDVADPIPTWTPQSGSTPTWTEQ